MRTLLTRLVKRTDGFTLTELAVAMLVVGIIASIAIPSFLGARNNAYDREAQASVDAALNAASMHYANNGDFTNSANDECDDDASEVLAADLQRLDPNYDFVESDEVSATPRTISVIAAPTYNDADDDLGCQAIYAVSLSRSGVCWVGRLTVEGQTLDDDNDYVIKVNTGTNNSTNEGTEEEDELEVNGKAYAGLLPTSPTAEGSDGTSIVAIADVCKADDLEAEADPELLGDDDWYDAWRTVTLVDDQP
jgi:prepilin-type N-terminal cleavage/methylation domain-containing protein